MVSSQAKLSCESPTQPDLTRIFQLGGALESGYVSSRQSHVGIYSLRMTVFGLRHCGQDILMTLNAPSIQPDCCVLAVANITDCNYFCAYMILQLQRLWRLQNKAKIKENNFARAKWYPTTSPVGVSRLFVVWIHAPILTPGLCTSTAQATWFT